MLIVYLKTRTICILHYMYSVGQIYNLFIYSEVSVACGRMQLVPGTNLYDTVCAFACSFVILTLYITFERL
jgi:hypothetical protein